MQAKSLMKVWNGKLYFVYLPSRSRYTKKLDDSFLHRDKVFSFVNELEILIVDISEVFSAHRDPSSLFSFTGHYTSEGNRLVAQHIERRLENILKEIKTAE